VGACVGMRGSRVRDIVKELHGERIDIIKWDDDIREYLPAAVSPAEIFRMVIDRANNTITLTVPKDQLSLLIGKKGRNIRLASKLLDWELVAESVEDGAEAAADISLLEVRGIGKKLRETLEDGGYGTAESLSKASVDDLARLSGIGTKTGEKLIAMAKEALEARRKEGGTRKPEEEVSGEPEENTGEISQDAEKREDAGEPGEAESSGRIDEGEAGRVNEIK
ncbi:MAG: helix-hairpin-helix domain-containing protein, partial [Candidatus Omnitrophota bacterium]